MTVYYIDFINGNDANTGLSWAQAWKTSLNGPTAARTVPGDVFRVAKSPDPVSVGSATWTTRKVGNSITFGTAPTTFITGGTAGWVTSSTTTVTNNQSTAYILSPTVSCVTSADTALMYKNLGATFDYSGNTQLSFWFRPAAAFDCTTTQSMTIQLCSDTAGTVVVDSLVMPKWNYSANTWYPIVIDKGSALGASIQSISIVTAQATTATFYFDEFFVSPADGITLHSLISKGASVATNEKDDWYPIKTIRGADVWLMASYSPGTAVGACISGALDCSYIGITETVTTYRRETIKPFTAAGPSATNFIVTNEAGTAGNNYVWSGGWNTATTIQDGETWLDNLVGLNSTIAQTVNYFRFENFGCVRSSIGFSAGGFVEFVNISHVGCNSGGVSSSGFTSANTINKTNSFKCFIGCGGNMTLNGSNAAYGLNLTVGNIWGTGNINIGAWSYSTLNIGNIYTASTTQAIGPSNNNNCVITIGDIEACRTTAAPNGIAVTQLVLLQGSENSVYYMGNLTAFSGAAGGMISNTVNITSIFNITSFNGTAPAFGITGYSSPVINKAVFNSTSVFYITQGTTNLYSQLVCNDYNNTPGYSRIYRGMGTAQSYYYELQTTDVRTAGSKAWKVSIPTTPTTGNNFNIIGGNGNLKLASVAAVANKLVTVSCYVKRTSVNQDAGILIDAKSGFLPGYTDNITSSVTGFGSFELVIVTFTPTQNCVFDVYAMLNFTTAGTCDVVWDDLSVSQAA